jgi:hypothetical protein
MRTTAADKDRILHAREKYELPDLEAQRLIDAGSAVEIRADAKVDEIQVNKDSAPKDQKELERLLADDIDPEGEKKAMERWAELQPYS